MKKNKWMLMGAGAAMMLMVLRNQQTGTGNRQG